MRCSRQHHASEADVAEEEMGEADDQALENAENQTEASEAEMKALEVVENQGGGSKGNDQASEAFENQDTPDATASGSEEQISVGLEAAPGSEMRRRLTATVTGSTVSCASQYLSVILPR